MQNELAPLALTGTDPGPRAKPTAATTVETYNDKVVRRFMVATIVWGIVGMSIGLLAAAQLRWPALNFDTPWLTFSRIRPDHTFGVIFAFGGNALMCTCFYVVQRTSHARLAFDKLAMFVFWGWQITCLAAEITMPLGLTQGKEYAEPEWWIDIMMAIVWVSLAVVFFGTLARRRIRHIYVANWYYGAFIIATGKYRWVRTLQRNGHCVMVIGDGSNDAAALAAADVSVSLAGATDLARHHADLLLGDDLGQLILARTIAIRTMRIARQNRRWGLVWNIVAIPLAACGLVPPWLAALGMSLSSLAVVLNALRLNSPLTAVEPPHAAIPIEGQTA